MSMYIVTRTIQIKVLLISKLVTVKSVGGREDFSPCHINLSHCCKEEFYIIFYLLQQAHLNYTEPVLQFCNIGCTVTLKDQHQYGF